MSMTETLLPFKCTGCGEVRRQTYADWRQRHDHYVDYHADGVCDCGMDGYFCPGSRWCGEFQGTGGPEWENFDWEAFEADK